MITFEADVQLGLVTGPTDQFQLTITARGTGQRIGTLKIPKEAFGDLVATRPVKASCILHHECRPEPKRDDAEEACPRCLKPIVVREGGYGLIAFCTKCGDMSHDVAARRRAQEGLPW